MRRCGLGAGSSAGTRSISKAPWCASCRSDAAAADVHADAAPYLHVKPEPEQRLQAGLDSSHCPCGEGCQLGVRLEGGKGEEEQV